MGYTVIDGYMLRRFIINGANMLIENKDKVDALNVFPVPDGDTGTNMSMTALSAAEQAQATNSPNISEVARAAAMGALKGARGNSGVILSQIYRGLARGLDGKSTADSHDISYALSCAMETAYKAVMRPKEGTILTIIRALSDKAQEAALATDSIDEVLKASLEYAQSILAKTPDMLPQLKQAGVVDSGGSGLLYIIQGGLESLGIDNKLIGISSAKDDAQTAPSASALSDADIKYGYCTEFFINVKKAPDTVESDLKKYLSKIGDSLVVVSDEDIIKIHVHTNNPGLVLERALKIGSLDKIKIENMRIQHTNLIDFAKQQPKQPAKDFGFAAVASGDGIADMFRELGCDTVIKGGQTMNPSTDDILSAIESINAKTVFLLPNNKNIILAAKQAEQLCEGKKIIVVETVSMPQGISAMVAFMPTMTAEENLAAMTEAAEAVITGQITTAVRDTTVDGVNIKKDDMLLMTDDSITATAKDAESGAEKLIDSILASNEDAALVTLYYGSDTTEDKAAEIISKAEKKHGDIDFELRNGGQYVYPYIISVE